MPKVQKAEKVEAAAPVVTFDSNKPHSVMCGVPNVHYLQNGKYFNGAGLQVELPVEDKRTETEKQLAEVTAERDSLRIEVDTLNAQIAKLQLEAKPVGVVVEEQPASETVVVDVKDGVVTTTKQEEITEENTAAETKVTA